MNTYALALNLFLNIFNITFKEDLFFINKRYLYYFDYFFTKFYLTL